MENLRYGLIYQAINTKNGKIYIGQTSQPFNLRINQHKYVARKNPKDYFHRALRKYLDSFEWSIVESNIPVEQLNNRECFWIKEKNTYIPNGYNSTLGGEGNTTLDLNEEEICQFYNDGFSGMALGEIYDCSSSVIYKILKKHNIKTRPWPEKIYNDQFVINLYLQIGSINKTAKEIGCVSGTIRNILNKNNIPIKIPRPDNIPLEFANEMKLLYESGLSCNNIANFYNVSSESIRQLLKSINVKIRTDNKVTCHPVKLIDKDKVYYFSSVRKAAEFVIKNNRSHSSLETVRRGIAAMLCGEQKTAYGYVGNKIDINEYINYVLDKKEV